MQLFPFSTNRFFLWFAHLAQFCIFASLIVFCSCQFVKSYPFFELSFLFWGMCHFQNSSQCSSVSFVMEPEWHFACFVIFFLIILFPLSLFLLGSCWAVRYLSPFKIRFPFLTSQVVLNCFYVSYMGRKTGDSICLCSLFLCSADFADSDFPDSVLTACGRALWITYWYFLNRYLHFPAQGHLLKLSLNRCMQ